MAQHPRLNINEGSVPGGGLTLNNKGILPKYSAMKPRYTLDDANRLIIRHNHKSLKPKGRFSIDKDNRLIYWLNELGAWRREYGISNKIRFRGNWHLDSNYDLELILDETKDQYKGDSLGLKGEIISVDRDALTFEIISYEKEGLILKKGTVPAVGRTHPATFQILKLSGSWQADEFNRIIFLVEKKTTPDILTLEGSWQINKNQQITYTYEKIGLKRKTKLINTLTFAGFWKIDSANKLTYILSQSSNSRFDFHVQLESPNLYPKEGVIKYRLGIGLKKKGGQQQKIIALYGTWKFSRAVSLIFEMEYFKGDIHSLEFGAEVNFNGNNEIIFKLKNEIDEDLGINLIFKQRPLKQLDAQVFLKLKKAQEEAGIEVGVKIPF